MFPNCSRVECSIVGCACLREILAVRHIHFEQAIVQSDLDEDDVFMRLPPGCGKLSGLIMKMKKILYELRAMPLESGMSI